MILGYIVNSKWHTKYQSLYLIDNTDFSIHYVKENDKILECENLYTLNNGSYFLYNILKNEIIIPSSELDFSYLNKYLNYLKKINLNIFSNYYMIEFCVKNKIKIDNPKINYLINTIEQLDNNSLKIDELFIKSEIVLKKSVWKSSEDYRGDISINTNISDIKFDKYLKRFFPVISHELAFIDVPTWGNTKISSYGQMISDYGEDKIEQLENHLKSLNNDVKNIFYIVYNKYKHLDSLKEDLRIEISNIKNKKNN